MVAKNSTRQTAACPHVVVCTGVHFLNGIPCAPPLAMPVFQAQACRGAGRHPHAESKRAISTRDSRLRGQRHALSNHLGTCEFQVHVAVVWLRRISRGNRRMFSWSGVYRVSAMLTRVSRTRGQHHALRTISAHANSRFMWRPFGRVVLEGCRVPFPRHACVPGADMPGRGGRHPHAVNGLHTRS